MVSNFSCPRHEKWSKAQHGTKMNKLENDGGLSVSEAPQGTVCKVRTKDNELNKCIAWHFLHQLLTRLTLCFWALWMMCICFFKRPQNWWRKKARLWFACLGKIFEEKQLHLWARQGKSIFYHLANYLIGTVAGAAAAAHLWDASRDILERLGSSLGKKPEKNTHQKHFCVWDSRLEFNDTKKVSFLLGLIRFKDIQLVLNNKILLWKLQKCFLGRKMYRAPPISFW